MYAFRSSPLRTLGEMEGITIFNRIEPVGIGSGREHAFSGERMGELQLKRVYEAPKPGDGMRILVDRLWPRGIAKDKARIDLWLKDIAPSDALRKRFHGHPDEWDAFCEAYAAELEGDAVQAAVGELLDRLAQGPVTLVYAARDETHNNAVALKTWLERQRAGGSPS